VIVETFPVGPLQCNCTILTDETTNEAIVVDGGDGVDDVLARLNARGSRATLLVHTHAHIDHIYDVARLRETTGGRALASRRSAALSRLAGAGGGVRALARGARAVSGDVLGADR